MQLYEIFDVGEIEFDENKTIAELVETAFEEYGYWEPAGMDMVTVYDIKSYRMILDRNSTCLEAGIGDWLCIAYYKPNMFYYVEGGWGHHMIQMNAVDMIESPVSFQLRFGEFVGSPVINGNITLTSMFNFLKEADYIDEDCNTLIVYEFDEYHSEKRINGTAKIRKLNIKDVLIRGAKLKELELSDKVCIIS